MKRRKGSKKTETIEVRVSPEQKADLAQLSANRAKTMSEVIRDLVERETARSGGQHARRGKVGTRAMILPAAPYKASGLAAAILLGLGISFNTISMNSAQANPDIRALFEDVDINGDGFISRAEYAMAESDVKVSYAEAMDSARPMGFEVPASCKHDDVLAKMVPVPQIPALEQAFASYDTNRDGTLSFEEASVLAKDHLSDTDMTEPQFATLDTDRNGALSQGEFDGITALALVGLDDVSRPCFNALENTLHGLFKQAFVTLDSNGNGQLDETEFANGKIED